MSNQKKMALGLLIGSATGGHPASWLAPATNASASTDIDYFRSLAQLAEVTWKMAENATPA